MAWFVGALFHRELEAASKCNAPWEKQRKRIIYSYPNYIPLPASAIERIMTAVEPFEFETVYGAFWDMVIERDGKAAVRRSAERFIRAIQG